MRTLLPQLYVILDRPTADVAGVDLIDLTHACARAGARLFQVRDKGAPAGALAALTERVLEAAWHYPDPFVLVNDRVDVAMATGADGVHLPASGLTAKTVRERLGRHFVIGCSAHDATELERAAEGGASFATLSPIYPTSSKPGYGPALGPEVFRDMSARFPELPLYALAGMTPERARACIAAGAHGAAVMSSIVRDPALVAAFPHGTII